MGNVKKTQHRSGSATTRRKRSESDAPSPVACSFGCGKPAEGSLSVYYNSWRHDEATPALRVTRMAMSLMLPACWECARGSVKLSVTLPAEAGE